MLKKRKLLLRIGTVVFPRFVGNGKMSIDAFCLQARQAAGRRDMLNACFRHAAVTQKAEAGHAGVHLDVYTQLPAKPQGFGGIFLGLGEIRHRLGEVIVRQNAEILRRRMAEDQDRQSDAPVPQFHRFIQAGYRKIVRSALLEQRGNTQRAVAVCIRLYYAEKPAFFRNAAPDGFIIMADVSEADLRPGAFLEVIHTSALGKRSVQPDGCKVNCRIKAAFFTLLFYPVTGFQSRICPLQLDGNFGRHIEILDLFGFQDLHQNYVLVCKAAVVDHILLAQQRMSFIFQSCHEKYLR